MSILRCRCSSRLVIVSSVSRTLVIAALLSGGWLVVGAAAAPPQHAPKTGNGRDQRTRECREHMHLCPVSGGLTLGGVRRFLSPKEVHGGGTNAILRGNWRRGDDRYTHHGSAQGRATQSGTPHSGATGPHTHACLLSITESVFRDELPSVCVCVCVCLERNEWPFRDRVFRLELTFSQRNDAQPRV